jgi:hypothetical protein
MWRTFWESGSCGFSSSELVGDDGFPNVDHPYESILSFVVMMVYKYQEDNP